MTRSALVLGARNLGGAIAAHLVADGWQVACAARSVESLAAARAAGALAVEADAATPAGVEAALAAATAAHGAPALVVNAVTASRPPASGAWGGGPIAEATLEGFHGWAGAVAEQAFVALSCSARHLLPAGGTYIQVTGGSARRALPGRGLWSAGAQATRAMVQAAAQELREQGVHVALLVVDGIIESPKTAASTADWPRERLVDQASVAAAVLALAAQGPRGLTHELVLTPAGDRWTP